MFFLLLLWICCCSTLSAQHLGGKVASSDGKPLDGANVTLVSSKDVTLTYCFSRKDGGFTLSYRKEDAPQDIVISMVGCEKKVVPLTTFKNGMTIVMKEQNFVLKEVKVTAHRIGLKGDTLTYSVAGFKQKQDRTLADVIAKMPGLEVKEGGQIEYQGRPINRFYIEGMDLMGSKYAMASNNISATKVKSVQVLQHHQPVKMLRGTRFSDQAALNIVLTDESKGFWQGSADIGLGSRMDGSSNILRNCRLMAMRFGKESQNVSLYKTTNSGNDISNEVADLYSLRPNHEEGKWLSPFSVSTPDIDSQRFTFNNAHLLAANQLLKLSADKDLRFQLNGLVDRHRQSSQTSTQYLLLDGMPTSVEEQQVHNTVSEWQGEMTYKNNASYCYVQNKLKGYADFDRSRSALSYNGVERNLTATPRRRYLTEDFQLIRQMKNGMDMDISSVSTYNNLPGSLLTINGQREVLHLQYFGTSNYVKFATSFHHFLLENKVGLDGYCQQMSVSTDSLHTKNKYRLTQLYYFPNLIFRTGSIYADASIDLSAGRQYYNGKSQSLVWIEPSFNFKYTMNALSSLSLSYSLSQHPLMLKELFDTPIFTSYKTVTAHSGKFERRTVQQLYLHYDYAQPVSGVFFNLQSTLSRRSNNILYASSLDGDIYRREATDGRYTSRSYSLIGTFTKSFGWAKTLLSLNAMCSRNAYKMLLLSNIDNGRMDFLSLSLHYSLRPLSFLSIEGKSSLQASRQSNLSHPTYSAGTNRYYTHQFDFNFFVGDDWQFTVNSELYHSTERSISDNYFCDLLLSYRRSPFELRLSLRNLWNNASYSWHYLSNEQQTVTMCQLRPQELALTVSFDM
jgi:hypothetical protein